MAFIDNIKRVAVGIGTGGLSEIPGTKGMINQIGDQFAQAVGLAPKPMPKRTMTPEELAAQDAFQRTGSAFENQLMGSLGQQRQGIRDINQQGTNSYSQLFGQPQQQPGSVAQRDQAIGMLQNRATGMAPSFTEQLMQQGLQQNVASQRGAMAGAVNNPLMARQIARQGAEMQQQTAQQAAMLRAQEQAQAEQALMSATGAAAGQDMQMQISQRAQELQAMGMDSDSAYRIAAANQGADTQRMQQQQAFEQMLMQGMLGSYSGGANISGQIANQNFQTQMYQAQQPTFMDRLVQGGAQLGTAYATGGMSQLGKQAAMGQVAQGAK